VTTGAEAMAHERATVDPCLPQKAAHVPFCIYRILHGGEP